MRRREYITLIVGAAAWPLVARAQQGAMPTVGFLSSGSPEFFQRFVTAYHDGLKEVGYIEGQNVAFEYRWASYQYNRLPALALDLVKRQVTVITAAGSVPSGLAAKAATTTIPIVFVASDPLGVGLVTSLSRPTENITGVSPLGNELEGKKLELLAELCPDASIIGVLVNPSAQNTEHKLKDINAAAHTLNRQVEVFNADTEDELDDVFLKLVQQRIVLLVGADAFFVSRINQIVALAARYTIPTIYPPSGLGATTVGGLMTYGANLSGAYRQAGIYTGRILKGEKPGELPVMQATKVQFSINLKTAKSLGLNVPTSILLRADDVIE